MRSRLAVFSVTLALAGATGVEPATPWTRHLSGSVSPGGVALLVLHADDPRVAPRLAEALRDGRPDVRAAAARAANVAGLTVLLPQVLAALAAETEAAAAVEAALAAVALGAQAEDVRAAGRRQESVPPVVDAALRARDRAAGIGIGRPAAAPRNVSASRIPGGFPPGLVQDVLQVAGCTDRHKEAFHGGQVEYGADNRPRRVTMLGPHGISAACMEAVEALLFMALRPGIGSVDGALEFLVVPLSRDAAACLAEAPGPSPVPEGAPSGEALRVAGTIREPKKVRHVAPWYPGQARDERVQGTVVLEATVAASGCVQEVKVLQGRDPRLDLVALLTVAQWAYTPTLLNGKPVPVIMTITVNFRLS
jgi:TonB family protein